MSSNDEKRIYLAGPVRHSENPTGWRNAIKDGINSVDFIDPMEVISEDEYRMYPQESIEKLTEKVKSSSGVFIGGWNPEKPSLGTYDEVIEANLHSIPVSLHYDGDIDDISEYLYRRINYWSSDIDVALKFLIDPVGLEVDKDD